LRENYDRLNNHRNKDHIFNKAANFFRGNKQGSTHSWRKATRIAKQAGVTKEEIREIRNSL
jgi:hypothetical protein